MPPSLRPARPADFPFIKEKVSAWSLDPDTLETGAWLVAEDPSGPVAFARLKPHPGFLELADLGVLPERRKSGIASQLVHGLLKEAGKNPVWLATQIPDFFEKFGFEIDEAAPQPLRDKTSRHCHNTAVTMQHQRS